MLVSFYYAPEKNFSTEPRCCILTYKGLEFRDLLSGCTHAHTAFRAGVPIVTRKLKLEEAATLPCEVALRQRLSTVWLLSCVAGRDANVYSLFFLMYTKIYLCYATKTRMPWQVVRIMVVAGEA